MGEPIPGQTPDEEIQAPSNVEGNHEIIQGALENKAQFEDWLNNLPEEGVGKRELVTQYLMDSTGLTEGDVSWISRPEYFNRFAEKLNSMLKDSSREWVPGKGDLSQIEQHGFTKQEILNAYYQSDSK